MPQFYVNGGVKFAGVDGATGCTRRRRTRFLPRVGFAYQLTPKTVIRGGAGLFAGFLGERRGDVITYGYSQETTAGTTTQRLRIADPAGMADVWLNTPIIEPDRQHQAGSRTSGSR